MDRHKQAASRPDPGSAEEAMAAGEPRSPRRRRGLVLLAGGIVFLVSLAWLGHSLFLADHSEAESDAPTNPTSSKHASHAKERSEQPTAPAHPEGTTAKLDSHAADLRRGDDLFREQRFDLALAVYQTLAANATGPRAARLQLRIALCHEELAQWDAGLAAYRTLAQSGTEQASVVGQLGQARIHLRRQQSAEARILLWPLYLQATRLGAEASFAAEAHPLLALALAADTDSLANTLDPLAPPPLVVSRTLDERLDWLTGRPGKAATNEKQQIVVAPAADKQEQTVLEATATLPVEEALEHLASAGSLHTEWSQAARKAAQERTVSLALAKESLILTAQGIGDPFGLVCRVEGETLHIQHADELDGVARTSYRRSLAQQVLEAVRTRHPRSPWFPAVLLALGNLQASTAATDARAQDAARKQALTFYEHLTQEAPRSQAAVAAHFNRGLLWRQGGDFRAARAAFYHVVDQAPAHALTPPALVNIGAMFIEEGEFQKAVSVLSRAERLAPDPRVRPRLLLYLAAAHLHAHRPEAARHILTKHRLALAADAYRPTANFLAAYVAYKSAVSNKKMLREDHELTAALVALPDDSPLGSYGLFLAGLAHAELGLWDETIRLYERTLPGVTGPLAQEMSFWLAGALSRKHRFDEARRLLVPLTATPGKWHDLAQLELATLDLQQNRAADCVARCRRLLLESTSLNLHEVFALLGRAYEAQGKFAEAARCYAFELP